MVNLRQNNKRWGLFSATLLIGVVCFILVILPQVSAITWDGIAYYKMDDNLATTNVINQVGENGTLAGGDNTDDLSDTGKIEEALHFNGIDDGVNLGDILDTDNIWSISVWFKLDTTPNGYDRIMEHWENGLGAERWSLAFQNNATLFMQHGSDFTVQVINEDVNDTNWHHVVMLYSGTNVDIYFDGSPAVNFSSTSSVNSSISTWVGSASDSSEPFDGFIDELGIWNRILNTTEIADLYNGGDGLPFDASDDISITIESPANDTTISDIGYNFTVSGNVTSSFNVTNVTYYVWNATSNLIFNQTTVILNNNESSFNNSLYIDAFVLGDYIWNAQMCWENTTFSNCTFDENNFTFDVVPLSVLSQSYSPIILEGDTSLFTINLSIITSERLSTASFVYNGTIYAATAIEYATNTWQLSFLHNIPEVTTTQNISFYWSVELESGFVSNTSSSNQTITQIAIDDCSVFGIQIFNFSLVDEGNQTVLPQATQNPLIKVDLILSYLDESEEVIRFSQNYTNINPARICMESALGNSSFRMDAVIEYSATDRFVEFYNIQNFTFNNNTQNQNITLYNLLESDGQEFKITYKGQDFIPITDMIVQIQRKYIEEGVFKVIEIPMIGTQGYTISHLVPNDVVYNFIFIKNGVVLDTFIDVVADCQNPTLTECEINLNALISGGSLIGIITEDDFFSSLSYDKVTRVVSSTFGILSGVSGLVQLNVTLLDNFGNQTVCSDSLTAAGGTLTCTVPDSFGNSTIYATITYDGEVRREGYISLKDSPKDQYAGIIIFSSIIMLLFIFGIGISSSPMITGVFLILGSIILVGLNLVYSTSWVGAGATILWFIVAVVIIIVKGGSKR